MCILRAPKREDYIYIYTDSPGHQNKHFWISSSVYKCNTCFGESIYLGSVSSEGKSPVLSPLYPINRQSGVSALIKP